MRIPQTRDELLAHVNRQIGFIRNSSTSFDGGDRNEAVRLATAIRILVHDTPASHSLFGQLGVKQRVQYLDTRSRLLEDEQLPPGTMVSVWDPGLAVVRLSTAGTAFAAPLEDSRNESRFVPFDDWWHGEAVKDLKGHSFERRNLVLALANFEGGAHVDPEIPEAYADLSRSNSLGFFTDTGEGAASLAAGNPGLGRGAMGSPVPANVRQIAFELEVSLAEQLSALLV